MSRSHTVEVLLNEALLASQRENRALDCYAIGCAALDHTLPNLAAAAFVTALDISHDRAKTMQAIVRSARQGRLPFETIMRSLVGSPAMQDESIQESLIYLSLLTGHKVDDMLTVIHSRRQILLKTFISASSRPSRCISKATTLKRAGLLIPLPQYRWHQGEAAVLASIIASAGKIDRASGLIQQIDPTQLLPEEHNLFDPYYNRVTLGTGLIGSIDTK